MSELLSVIVPVYNSQDYIKRCIDSVLAQSYKHTEVIIVDDGSTDETGVICDEIKDLYDNVYVFHRDNQGSTASRLLGIEQAHGVAITFIDSDDWIDPDMYEKMMDLFTDKELDMVISGLTYEYDNEVIYEIDEIPRGLYERKQIEDIIIPCMIYNDKTRKRAVTPSLVNKIFRRELLLESVRGIDIDISYGGDAAIAYISIACAQKIFFTGESWYHYFVRKGSLSRTFSIKSFSEIKVYADYLKNRFNNMGILSQLEEQINKDIEYFLEASMEYVYGIKSCCFNPYIYMFPFEEVNKGSRIIIYGAGDVGRSYIKLCKNSNYLDVAGWIDKNYDKMQGREVSSPDSINSVDADYVVIAIFDETVASSIKDDLISLGINEEKIVWKKPIKVFLQ